MDFNKKFPVFNSQIFYQQEDSKIYISARYLEKFFDEQLIKWLPFCIKRFNGGGNNDVSASKRPRLEETVVIGDDDDDMA